MEPKIDVYDDFADEYAKLVARREEAGIENEPIIPRLLEIIGNVSGWMPAAAKVISAESLPVVAPVLQALTSPRA